MTEDLVLGDSSNFQTNYVTKKGFDYSYESDTPEFEFNLNFFLRDYNSFTFGLTKYFDNNNLKMQAAASSIGFTNGSNQTISEFLIQIIFLFSVLLIPAIIFGQNLAPNSTGSFIYTPEAPLNRPPIEVF